MLVYDFMSEYNYSVKKYGRRWANKFVAWEGKLNGCEVEVKSDFFYNFKNSHCYLSIFKSFVKEVQDV